MPRNRRKGERGTLKWFFSLEHLRGGIPGETLEPASQTTSRTAAIDNNLTMKIPVTWIVPIGQLGDKGWGQLTKGFHESFPVNDARLQPWEWQDTWGKSNRCYIWVIKGILLRLLEPASSQFSPFCFLYACYTRWSHISHLQHVSSTVEIVFPVWLAHT